MLAFLAAVWYRFPSKNMIVIGVTGTNGKSTTTQFIGRMLEGAGEKVGWTTTASFKIANQEWMNDKKMTMLGRFQTQKLLRDMVRAGCTHAIIETSSQGISQSRHIGIQYDIVVFTNLTPEHIEAHGGFENYKHAKGRLFAKLKKHPQKHLQGKLMPKISIVNINDEHTPYFLSFPADIKMGFGLHAVDASFLTTVSIVPTQVTFSKDGTSFTLAEKSFHIKTIGSFYLANALAAITTLRALGKDWNAIQHAIEHLDPVPGRLEQINEGQAFTVIVDYAYEPAALCAVYDALKVLSYKKLIHIVGSCGGGRDVARRAILGRLAAEHDDVVIVANEDPYDEDPMQIVNDVADAAMIAGKKDGVDLLRILDRQEAINKAMQLAELGDLVLITGKGSEPVMAVGRGKKIPWDDRMAARKAIHTLQK